MTTVAYEESLLLITYLVEAKGELVVRDFLSAFEAGEKPEAALARLTGLSAAELEADFRCWVLRRRSAFQAIASIFNLWTFCAILAVAAIVRYRVRRRRLRQLSDGDEENPPLEDSVNET